jgi:hypothetical protein
VAAAGVTEVVTEPVSDYDRSLHAAMMGVALLRYGWKLEDVDVSAVRLLGRRYEGRKGLWAYSAKHHTSGQVKVL